MFLTSKTRSRGFSIVEILIALGVLVVLMSFATPAINSATAKTELHAAAENLEFSVRTARNTARQLETDVVMHFHIDPQEDRHAVTFAFPARKAGAAPLLQDFQFSSSVRLVSDTIAVRFDSRGMPDVHAQIILVSNQDEEISQTLMIQ